MDRHSLGVVEIARLLGMSRVTVHGWIRDGKLKAYRTPGRHFRVRPDDLVDFLRGRGAPIPESLANTARPRRLALVGFPEAPDELTALCASYGVGVEEAACPLRALLDWANDCPQVVVAARPLEAVDVDVWLAVGAERHPGVAWLAGSPQDPDNVLDQVADCLEAGGLGG